MAGAREMARIRTKRKKNEREGKEEARERGREGVRKRQARGKRKEGMGRREIWDANFPQVIFSTRQCGKIPYARYAAIPGKELQEF
ncbi:MAG: hypothetical protein D6734_01000 [Candidatus Schekmanbacteria bacterium]|nr:MAG: hypothetical protein D6734_01000 [Candidatus Schekmanbacteria bacterium]